VYVRRKLGQIHQVMEDDGWYRPGCYISCYRPCGGGRGIRTRLSHVFGEARLTACRNARLGRRPPPPSPTAPY
jgi:hypothetical protein